MSNRFQLLTDYYDAKTILWFVFGVNAKAEATSGAGKIKYAVVPGKLIFIPPARS